MARLCVVMEPRPRFNIKMSSYQYRKSHCGDKTILRPSYLHKGISYTGKTTSLYWIRTQATTATTFFPTQLQTGLSRLCMAFQTELWRVGEFSKQYVLVKHQLGLLRVPTWAIRVPTWAVRVPTWAVRVPGRDYTYGYERTNSLYQKAISE